MFVRVKEKLMPVFYIIVNYIALGKKKKRLRFQLELAILRCFIDKTIAVKII